MPEHGEGYRSVEEVAAAIKVEFQINPEELKSNRGAVMAKAIKLLNGMAQKSHDYSKIERLTQLLNIYDRMSGGAEGTLKKAA
ncbi:hypothetical protein A3F52_05240 [Candidatus Uhrbacteria bacterium RIFCSPHIGHO2_12_FULL_47_11]|nr:MAG: hypothetical protein A2753_00180 [Candidatus Uhrbacteria bacterium RIFCSPHIGHO2_01_FULL_47_11]OGL68198.1 MAG: hypothetical protein A3D58_04280 [Candidatus Uhrbacteria bacterium RIFCSPHIGHO2_02_FULL_46_47]OGL76039.1 MAG: hypothetical protein A3F52_05240 [Candidatus Uhrbacteria bacterium RIFCSPHIGHO2_12_FULL_47_11]OGL83836.1 MAG: hypothetical protein A3J03_02960 [Candidatus Uhrbacteria bacterium RIFCSPLOWO2_02_FULL_46_25]OGL92379.1 MAG: hypothetical protein A3H11_03365 [Candidatus Uhrbact